MGMGAQQPGQQPQVPPQGGKAGGGQAPTTPGQVPPQGGKAQQPGQPGLSTYADPYRGQPQLPPQPGFIKGAPPQTIADMQRGYQQDPAYIQPPQPGQVPPQGGKAQQPGQPGQAAIPSWAQPFVQKLGPGQPPSQQPTGYPPVQPGQPQLPPQGGKGYPQVQPGQPQLPPQVQPTGPTGLTSNFYDPSYGIDRGFADQMTARNKAMQGMDSGQIQYDPASKSFYNVGAMGQRNGPSLSGTYDQMYHGYDINNQLRDLGTPGSLTPRQQAGVAQAGVAQAGTSPFNAAQIDFMNKNQDVFGGYGRGREGGSLRDLGIPGQGGKGYPQVDPGKPQLPPQVKGLPPVQTMPPRPAPAPVPVKKAAPAPVAAKKVVVPPQKAGLAGLGIMGRR